MPVNPQTQPEPAPVPNPRAPLAAILEESNITRWHAVGGILLVAGLTGLIRFTWNGAGRYLVLALLVALTGGLYGLAQSRGLREFKIGRVVLMAISAVLAPLDIVAANAAHLFGLHLGTNSTGLAASLISLPFYVLLWRRVPGRAFTAFFAADAAVCLHFLLQTLLPKIAGHSGIYQFYGFAYAPLAGLYFMLASRTSTDERRRLLTSAGHISTLLGFLVTLTHTPGTGEIAGVLACIAADYALGALLLADTSMLAVSASAALLGAWGGVLHLRTHRIVWYDYTLAAYGVAAVYAAGASRLNTVSASLAEMARKAAEVQLGLGLVPMSAVLLLGGRAFPAFWPGLPDLLWAIGLGGVAIAVYRLLWSTDIARWCAAWVFFLALTLFCETCLPHHAGRLAADLGLLLSLTAVFARWGLKDRMTAGCLALAATVATAITLVGGSHIWPADVALLTLIAGGILDLRDGRVDDDTSVAVEVLWLLALAIGLTLHLETRFLPWAHRHLGIEPNFGYGLIVVFAACVALKDRWEGSRLAVAGRILGQSSLALAVIIACFQAVLAILSVFVYSPLLLLEILVAIEAADAVIRRCETSTDAVARRCETSATAAQALQALCSGVWVFQRFERPPLHHFDLWGIAVFAFGAIMLAIPAQRLRLQPLRLGTVFSLYAVYVQTVAALFHPHAIALAFWMTPLTVIAYSAAYVSSGSLEDEWRSAIRQCCYAALAVTTLMALSIVVTVNSVWEAGSAQGLLSLNAVFVSVIAAVRRSEAAAKVAFALHAVSSGFWLLERLGTISPCPSDLLGIAVLSAGTLSLGALGHLLRMRSLCLSAVIAGYATYLQIVVTSFHPDVMAVCLWLMAPTAVLYAVGVVTVNELWWSAIEPCTYAVTAITTLAALGNGIASIKGGGDGTALGLLCFNGLFVGAVGVLRRDSSLLVLSTVFMNTAYYFAIRRYEPSISASESALLFGFSAPVWMLVSAGVPKDGWLGQTGRRSFRLVAAVVSGVSCLLALGSIHSVADANVIVTMLIAGCVFAANRVVGGAGFWQHIAFAAFVSAYACFLSRTFGPPTVALGDAYLAPVGLYVIGLGAQGQRRRTGADYRILLACGLLLLMTPSLLAAMYLPGDIVHALLLVTEAVLAIWYGLANRIRVAAVIGLVFLFAVISSQLQGYTTRIHWAVYATLLGLAIIGSALLLERRREDVLRLKKRVETYFQEWD